MEIGMMKDEEKTQAQLIEELVSLRQIVAKMGRDEESFRSEDEKEVLLREVHHRVKKNFQTISSLCALQATQIKDEETRALLQDLQNRVNTMFLIHDKLQQSQDLARIDLADYLRTLAESIVHSTSLKEEDISLEFQLKTTTLDIDTVVSCGLIVNELVTNALRHAFAEDQKGTIGIGLQTDGDTQTTLEVWDNGKGIPPEMDPLLTESLGLKLVMILVKQIHGKIGFHCSNGTRVEIMFNPRPKDNKQR